MSHHHSLSPLLCFSLLFALPAFLSPPRVAEAAGASKPGGAGHALLFDDHVLVKSDFKHFPSTAMTFEAWISTSDFCHAGTIMSYAKNSHAKEERQRTTDYNHFVIFDPRNLLACHDYEFIDLVPDVSRESCHAAYTDDPKGSPSTAKFVERGGDWHHLAVTWDGEADGLTNIYMDGLLMASAVTHKTDPLVPDGAFMLGGEQDCFGGCTDPSQGFHGKIDEVRLWRKARSQTDILKTMRWISGLEHDADLIAWWKFDEPGDSTDHGHFVSHRTAHDSSKYGNHLSLLTEPRSMHASIPVPGAPDAEVVTGLLQFRNNFALQKQAESMPSDSFTVEFWARGGAVTDDAQHRHSSNLFSYATESVGQDDRRTGFMDDAIRIERLLSEQTPIWIDSRISTVGSIALHVNSNEHTDAEDSSAWVYFDAQWTDDKWHHIAASWDGNSGTAKLYFDGKPTIPFWKAGAGSRSATAPDDGGVDPILAPLSRRKTEGSLVLGQDQNCYAGCFSSSNAFNGDMAVVRVWRRVLEHDEITANMAKTRPGSTNGLAALYIFDSDGLKEEEAGGTYVVDRSGVGNHLELRSSAPGYVYSTAPLALSDGRPVAPPKPGGGGYSLALNDKQVLLATDFKHFPSVAITLEFWMFSTDTCRPGVPFSYASGDYAQSDNSFLLFNYNSWGVSVMEDEGRYGDHLSGVSATDGNWHHVAVTWESSTGKVTLYDNGRPEWTTYRGKGKTIPSAGTLVIGHEQDCAGGCFDSASGAAGRTSAIADQEYGAQDFFGVIEEMRVWSVVRSPEEVRRGMDMDDGRGPGGFNSPGIDPATPGLVAYWKFDEGSGYVVHDVSGHGNDLSITQPPKWEVTRWLSTCGNAVVEGEEECDDGDLTDGDGCSSACKVERGWECAFSPSKCWKKAPPPHAHPQPPQPSPSPSSSKGSSDDEDQSHHSKGGSDPSEEHQDSNSSRGSRKQSSSFVITLLALLGCAGAAAIVTAFGFVHRQRIARLVPSRLRESFAQSFATAGSVVSDVLPLSLRERLSGYSFLHFAPNEDLMQTPDFMAFAPGPATERTAPGHAGPYESFTSQGSNSRLDSRQGENALV